MSYSSLGIIFIGRACCFTLIVFPVSCDCEGSAALPQGVVDWSEVNYCGIFCNTHLHFAHLAMKQAESATDTLTSPRNISCISCAVKLSLSSLKNQFLSKVLYSLYRMTHCFNLKKKCCLFFSEYLYIYIQNYKIQENIDYI